MKFTIEQVLEAIRAKFMNAEGKTSLQVSDRTVKETLESLLPIAGEDMELADFIDKFAFKTIESMNKNYIKDTTDFVKNYQPPKPTEPTPAPKPVEPAPTPQPFNMEDFLKQISETQKATLEATLNPLKEKIASLEQENSLKARTALLSEKRAGLNFSQQQLKVYDQAMMFVQKDFGNDATAEQIHDAAYKKFHELAEVFGVNTKPLDGDTGKGEASSGFRALVDTASKSQDSGQGGIKAALGLSNN